MAPADPPPPSGTEASAGSTPPTWPDVSRMSRGYQVGYGADTAARRAPVWIAAVTAVFLGVVGLGVVGVLATHGPNRSIGIGSSPTGGPVTGGTGASNPGSPTPGATDPAPRAQEGDCISITGPSDRPVIQIVPCGPDTYLVVMRFDGTADKDVCATVPDSNSSYRHKDPDFVLCLRR